MIIVQPIFYKWNRIDVHDDYESLYIFTDNLCRTSGKIPIDIRSWYWKKYSHEFGTLYRPTVTQAVIRGLPNAYPISTMKDYGSMEDARLGKTQFTEDDFELFSQFIDDEVETIKNALPNFKYLKHSATKLGHGEISKLPLRLQAYLDLKLLELGIKNIDLK